MNQLQPTAGWSAATQRMDDRRAAAESYRLARMATPNQQRSSDRFRGSRDRLRDSVQAGVARWRDRAGNALISLGKRITVHVKGLEEV